MRSQKTTHARLAGSNATPAPRRAPLISLSHGRSRSHAPKPKASEKLTRPPTPAQMAYGSRYARAHGSASAAGARSRARGCSLAPTCRGSGVGRGRDGTERNGTCLRGPRWCRSAQNRWGPPPTQRKKVADHRALYPPEENGLTSSHTCIG